MANAAALYKTLDYIEAHPGEWDQSRWHTCFAGITCRLAGFDDDQCFYVSISMSLLELTDDDLFPRADWCLFSGTNTLDDLRRIVAWLASPPPPPLPRYVEFVNCAAVNTADQAQELVTV